MDRAPDLHLHPQELAELYEQARQHADSPPEAMEVHPHLASCSVCRELFQELSAVENRLADLRSAPPGLRQAACPDPSAWYEIAAGVTPPAEALVHVLHASRCDGCGPLLRDAVTILNGEMTALEAEQIAALASARPDWRQKLARQITGRLMLAPAPLSWWKKPWLTAPGLATAAALVLVMACLAWWGTSQRSRPLSVDRLLASAYSEQRTLELRIPGAPYAPLRVQRGPEDSFVNRPKALLNAEALIAGQLASHPSDSYWLQAKARVDLLEGKYEPAVDSLRHALQLEPKSPGILTDLASAYFQRGQAADRPEDYAAAYEHLSQALAVAPDDPVALFNRAIVSERQFLYHQALDDWEHYLRIDPRSEWADEARKRADAVRAKLKQHESANRPLLSPAEIAASATPPADLDERVEQYLDAALQSWLPAAYPETNSAADPIARQALFFLADLTSQQHNDRWLSDLLGGSSAPNFPQAVAALARAVQANHADGYEVAREQAGLAEGLFRTSGNTAGALRAEFERTFADQISRRSDDCRRRSIAAGAEARRHSYPWVQIQLGLEESVCSELMGDLGTHEKAARRAQDQAQQAGYGALYLRALGFVAESKLDTGDRSSDWKLLCAGLKHYWSRQFPAMPGYNLYVEEALAAEADQASLQLAIWREAAAVIDVSENLLLRAEAHSSMANAASAAHQPEVAEHHYEEAARFYALAPQTEATRANRLGSEIMTAQVETGQSAFDAALVRLAPVQDEVRQLSNNFLAQIFYSALGEVQLRRHHEAEAEQAFRAALRLAEQSLASLTSEKSRTSWSKDAAPVYLGLAEAELVQGREQESLDVFEWYLGASQRVGRLGPDRSQSLPDPSRLQARLPLLSNQTVFAFGVLPNGLAIWVYDDRGVSAKWIPKSPQELQDLAANFYAQCSDPSSALSALRRDARSLYGALIAPVERYLAPGRTLVIEADGWLARVPFEALLDSNDHYLIERAPIVHSLGQDSQARLRSDTGISADLPALVVASTASAAADGLIPLPDVAAEADTVAGGFHFARVLKGGEATLSAVRNELPAAAVFHFAGHSLAAPEKTGLLLEGVDGPANAPHLMDANVVRQLHPQRLQLAFLSACSTASGSGGPSGFDSVTDALVRAGVPHVVASRWTVDSTETRGFVQDFYHNALSGQSVSDAIRLTSRRVLANPRTSHPYYWSAFAAYGRP